jgi:hypothetical protein
VSTVQGEKTAGTSTRRAIARIDDALAASISRNTFSRNQALRTLSAVEASIGDPSLTGAVAVIINEAAASYCGEMLVDRGRFLDTLLDLRALLVGRPSAVDDAR